LGQRAPDFSLPDLDGAVHTLSAQAGAPVVLVYFATW
jgi:peroxiredoxin